MTFVSSKIALAAIAAGALAGHVSAFVPPSAAALRGGVIGGVSRSSNQGVLGLRAQAGQKPGQKESFAISVDNDTMTRDPGGYQQVEVKGEFLEDGWVDESAPAAGGFFAGLFGAPKPSPFGKKRAPQMSKEKLSKELDKIEFVDGSTGSLDKAVKAGTAVPFGGLNPNQVAIYKKQKEEKAIELMKLPEGRFVMYPEMKGAAQAKQAQAVQAQGIDAQIAALPDGWFTAYDESTQSEYYYNEAGESKWERPTVEARK